MLIYKSVFWVKEILNNFMLIGSSTPLANEYLVSDYSNYGKKNVGIFALGEYIYTTKNKKNDYASGTSYSAPVVSGITSLIRSYYPSLSASEVKQIIMESGVSYDIMVNKPSTSEEKELVSFSVLSKSGKVVNAYNALLMVEQVSKKKKKATKTSMYILWSLINAAFVILFFALVLTLFTKGKKLFNNRYGNPIIIILILGVLIE